MGNLLFKEEDPTEAKFLGMKFKCDTAHFVMAIKEEFELMFLAYYIFVWLQTTIWSTLGLVIKKSLVIE